MQPSEMRVDMHSADLAHEARALPPGSRLTLDGVVLGASVESLDLERVEVFAEDFALHVDGRRVNSPMASVRYRGHVTGDPTSRVLVTFRPDGSHRGLVVGGDGAWVLEGGGPVAGLPGVIAAPVAGRVDSLALGGEPEGFDCALDQLHEVDGAAATDLLDALWSADAPAHNDALAVHDYTARIAVETDWEFYQKFGNVQDATDYVGDLFAYASLTYEREVGTSLEVGSLFLWSGSADPWNQSSAMCGLLEFGGVWNADRGDVDRTLAHFLSGKSINSGIAWVGVLCSGSFAAAASGCTGLPSGLTGGAYGYTGGIDGDFSIASPQILWDVVAVMHEIGHNFNSPHTHCYNGLGGNSQPVDQCRSGETGCYSGSQTLPGSGSRTGTLMSYCHLLSGGFDNVEMTFGRDHSHGVEPDRVPDRMRDHVELRAGAITGCLVPTVDPGLIFADTFESGDLTSWGSTFP